MTTSTLKRLRPCLALSLSLFLSCAWSIANTAWAQSNPVSTILLKKPSTPTETKSSKNNDNSSLSDEQQLAAVEQQQADTQLQLERATLELVRLTNALNDLPNDATDNQKLAATAAVTLQQIRVDAYSQINDGLKDLERQTLRIIAAQDDLNKWSPPNGNAPWSLLDSDEVIAVIIQLRQQLLKQDRHLSVLDRDIADQKKLRTQAEIDLRQAMDRSPAQQSTGTTEVSARNSVSALKEKLERIDLELAHADLDRTILLAQRRLTSIQLSSNLKTWQYFDHRFVFSREDLKAVTSRSDKKILELRQKEAAASANINQLLSQAKQAKLELDKIEATTQSSAEVIAGAKQKWLKLDSTAAALRVNRENIRALIDIEASRIKIWNLRHEIRSTERSNDKLKAAQEELDGFKRRLDQGLQYLSGIADEKAQMLVTLKEQGIASDTKTEQDFYDELVKQVNLQMEDVQLTHLEANRFGQLLTISEAELAHWLDSKNLVERAKKIGVFVKTLASNIWHFELLAVDDTMLIDGREIKTKRSVTVGKSLGALAILLVGFSLLSTLIRRTLALAVSKGNLNASRSVIMGRWLTFIAGITLILTAFNLVEIPLSAFAFFGGALAIGVGFGTQNLLKNLISGVMLLVEKPVRIGDMVEVDGVSGTVTSIGIRFSTLHSAHGTDTLIPNSVLVEQKLVNWTYSTADVRREIKVTVGYSSDVSVVTDLMLKACEQETNILDTPTPVVTLDDFGDNGLLFNLQVWLALQKGNNVAVTLSQLRMSILAAFREAGIELPYPQRVVHLNKD